MSKRALQFGILSLVTLAASVWAANAFAQRRPRVAEPRDELPAAARDTQPRNGQNLPPGWIGRLRQMTPEQQEKFFNNNARFRKLPPESQAQLRQNLQAWNNLTPEQRQTLLQRERAFQQFTPEQQRYISQTLLPEYRNLAPAGRAVVLQKYGELSNLSDSQRAEKLNDEAFISGLNPQERQVLRDLSNLHIGAGEASPE